MRTAQVSPHDLMLAILWTDRRARNVCLEDEVRGKYSSTQAQESTVFTSNEVPGDSISYHWTEEWICFYFKNVVTTYSIKPK